MTDRITHRLITPEDAPALEAIIAATPDAGLIGFANDYQADLVAIRKALATNLQGAVALWNSTVIGMVFGDLLRVQWAGGLHQAVYLSDLRVHPDFQRQGVARGLTDWGIAYVKDLLGPRAVLYGAVMEGNVSLSLAHLYQFQATDLIQGGIVPMRKTPPKLQPGLVVRPAANADLPAIAEGVNRFYRDHNLWSPASLSLLESFLDQEVAGVYPNQLYVVTRGNQILGGLSLSDRTNLVRMRISHAPAYVRTLGTLLGVLPKSGILRALTIRRVWFVEGELNAGRYLWQQLRYRLRDRGNCLGIAYDPSGRLAELFRVPFWLPMFKARYLVRAPEPSDAKRHTYCVAGP